MESIKFTIALILILTLLSVASSTYAENNNSSKVRDTRLKQTRVIHDGYGKSTKGYISKVKIGSSGDKESVRKFPIVTKEMSVGRVGENEAKDLHYEVASRPMFIVGYDRTSIEWLKSNAELLIERNAIGYVANVQSAEQMDHLNMLLNNNVFMMPMNVSDIAQKLNIQHYPFYMDKNGVLR